MVIESMVSPLKAEKNPPAIMLLGFTFVTLAVWLATAVLEIEPKSMMMLVFVVIPSIPFILKLFESDEMALEEGRVLGSRTLAKHFSVILVLIAYFLGMTIGFTFWYVYLPEELAHDVFSIQIEELKGIKAIGANLSGAFLFTLTGLTQSAETGAATSEKFAPTFEIIFLHNLWVLFLIIAFSVIYGAGSVFILVWNASVVGVFLANFARQFVFHESTYTLASGVGVGLLGLIPHGSFELLSYLIGAMAGGVLSAAIVRGRFSQGRFWEIMRDVAKMMAWAIVLLALGALVESGAIVF
ncbi:stage II sporulation protein M [Candidatus Micrarchaeota archaeon]|nr:stage II sporulation protein M [Candidatus Micrarchaeota archaeon]